MIGTRYDEYAKEAGGLPFVLYADLERSALKNSKEKNWHEELEIELCESGSGTVLLNGEKQLFGKGDGEGGFAAGCRAADDDNIVTHTIHPLPRTFSPS